MIYLSKSKYCGLWQCPKIVWMKKYKPEELVLDENVLSRMESGNEVGDLAMGLFGDYIEVTAYKNDQLDLSKMIEHTKAEMANGTPVICEASFEYNGLYCAVDILKKEDDGWAIYEVKSSVKHEHSKDIKPVYIADVAYQKYVLESCGVKIAGTYLVCINGDYIFDGTLDIQQLFTISDIAEAVAVEENNISANLLVAERVLSSPYEPDIDLSTNCNSPYLCGFWNYCSKHLPQQSVFNLYGMGFDKKIKFYKNGITTYQELLDSAEITNKTQLRQIEFALQDIEKILVHERDRKGSIQTTQEVEIYFNFVGRFVPPAFGEVELTPEKLEEIRKREERKDRLHQNYLKRKASGAQKRYEDKIKKRKKAEIEAKKAAIRAEDIAKGVFVPVSSLPQREPMKGVQTA